MIITRHNKIFCTWKKLKANKKNEMRIKENKEKKSNEQENKNYEEFKFL